MMRIIAMLWALALAGCAATVPVLPSPQNLRDTNAQIASQTNVTAARLAGDWVIRQDFPDQTAPGQLITLSVAPQNALVMTVRQNVCTSGSCDAGEAAVQLVPVGPGRWAPAAPTASLPNEIWVMWMDFDDRTAAIGTPAGTFGWIMDKSRNGGRDRIIAARDIMGWFGYDLDLLADVPSAP